MDNEEIRKVKELMKEKGDTPLQWMYKESKPDDEDYLLGKKIGSLNQSEQEKKQENYEQILGERIQANIALDVKAKIREDPLFTIRHKEEEAKKRLLQNPVKMKRLQKALARKEAEKKKKSKKKHKHRKSDSDGSEDDIMAKYLTILNQKRKGGNSASNKPPNSRSVSRSPSREREWNQKRDDTDRGRKAIQGEIRRERYSDSDKEGGRFGDKRMPKDNYHRNRYTDDNECARQSSKQRYNEDNEMCKGRSRDEARDRRRERYIDSAEDTGRVSDRPRYNKDNRSKHAQDRNKQQYYSSNKQGSRSDGKNKETKRREKYSDSESDEDTGTRSENYSRDRSRSDNRNGKRKDTYANSDDEVKHRRNDTDISRSRNYKHQDRYERKPRENSNEYRNSHRGEHRHEPASNDIRKQQKKGNSIKRRKSPESSTDSSSSDSEDTSTKKASKYTNKSRRHSSTSDSESDSYDRHRKDRPRSIKNERTKSDGNGKRKATDSSSSDSDSSSPERKTAPKGYGLLIKVPKDGTSTPEDRQSGHKGSRSKRSRSPSPKLKNVKKRQKSRSPQQPRRKLSDEEKRKRLEEMMENAKWREDQRSTNVKKYATEDRDEEVSQEKNYETTGSSEFVNPMMSLHADSSSVEDRIKRNRHNILRTTADMDHGFSKK